MSGYAIIGEQIADYLRQYGATPSSQLAEVTGAPYYTVRRAVVDLEARGVIERSGGPRDLVWDLVNPPAKIPRVNSVWQLGAVL